MAKRSSTSGRTRARAGLSAAATSGCESMRDAPGRALAGADHAGGAGRLDQPDGPVPAHVRRRRVRPPAADSATSAASARGPSTSRSPHTAGSGTPGGTSRRRLARSSRSRRAGRSPPAPSRPARPSPYAPPAPRPCAAESRRTRAPAAAAPRRRRRTRPRTARPPPARARPPRRTGPGCCPAGPRPGQLGAQQQRRRPGRSSRRRASTTQQSVLPPDLVLAPSQSKNPYPSARAASTPARQSSGATSLTPRTRPANASSTASQGLGRRRAAGHEHVDRHQLVDPLGHRVRVPVGPAGGRAGPEGRSPWALPHPARHRHRRSPPRPGPAGRSPSRRSPRPPGPGHRRRSASPPRRSPAPRPRTPRRSRPEPPRRRTTIHRRTSPATARDHASGKTTR